MPPCALHQPDVVHSKLSLCAIWVAGRVAIMPDGPRTPPPQGNGLTASQLAIAANASYGPR